MARTDVCYKAAFLGLLLLVAITVSQAAQTQSSKVETQHRRKIMIVAVAHLDAKNDLHNANFDDPLSPKRQKEIAEFITRLAAFHPTKVMIEAPFGEEKFQEQYSRYLKGGYELGANEIYQFGFRLAALAKNQRVYPIDTTKEFSFDYDSVKQSAEREHASAILQEADAHSKPYETTEERLIAKGTILELVRFLNTAAAINRNASWYLYVDRVGAGSDYAGAELVSNWYARNLHIFANALHYADSPDDRVVVFIGAGHARLLRDCVKLSPDLEFVDPESYLGSGKVRDRNQVE